MALWKFPPRIKVYEALGAVADKRIEVSQHTAKVWSSKRDKYYSVVFDPTTHMLSCNDNGSYWQGYVGYPALAFFMYQGILHYDQELGQALRGIAWKEVNTAFNNDFSKTEQWIAREILPQKGISVARLEAYAAALLIDLEKLQCKMPIKKVRPPKYHENK